MLNKKDLNFAELEAKVSKSPTTVLTANGEVRTNQEATVFVKDLNLLVTVMLFEDTLAHLSLRKTLRSSRIFLPTGPVVRNHDSSKMKDE